MRLIDADATKKAIKTECNPYGAPTIDFESGKKVLNIIDNAPTVESITVFCENADEKTTDELKKELEKVMERPQGEWINGREISRTMIGSKVEHIEYKDYTCSNCGLVLDNLLYWRDGSPFYKFCPNCGADMRGDKE